MFFLGGFFFFFFSLLTFIHLFKFGLLICAAWVLFVDYLSDDEPRKRVGQTDMSVFRGAVQDCLDYDTETAKKALKSKSNVSKASNDSAEVEKFSGLRIR